jgi:hypothetical protein
MCLDSYIVHDLCFQALRLDLSSVLKDQSLLYPFIQFLKGEGCVNILQFCLDVGKIFLMGCFTFLLYIWKTVSHYSVVCIAVHYRLDSPGIESHCWQDWP